MKNKISILTLILVCLFLLNSCNSVSSNANKMAKLVCAHQKLYEKLHGEAEAGNVKALSELQESKKVIDDFKEKLKENNYSQEEKDKLNEIYRSEMDKCGVSGTSMNDSKPSLNGTYSYSDNSVELVIEVNGESWNGKTMLISGFGSNYDNQNAKNSRGVVKGSELFESSGSVKVGNIEGRSLNTSIGGQSVTLSKN